MNLTELLQLKRNKVELRLDDIFTEEDCPEWKQHHPTGPVHVQIRCLLCGELLATDLREYGWLHNSSFAEKHLRPHLAIHA